MTHVLRSFRSGEGKHPYRVLVCLVTIAAVLAGMAPAGADDIANNLDGTVDADAEALNLTVGGASSSVGLRVIEQNDDGKNGCNLTGDKTVTFSVSSSNGSVATVTPSSVTFTSCGDAQSIMVSPGGAAGTSTVSLSVEANGTKGSFNTAPATFTVNVAAAPAPACPAVPTSAPQVVVSNAPASTGWYNASSLAAGFTISPGANAEYSLDNGASWQPYASEVVFSSDGRPSVIARNFRPASAGCTRQNGPASAAQSFKIDRTSPVLDLSVTPDANPAGWNKTNVVVGWTCTETGSGLVGTCPADVTYVHGDNVAPADFSVTDMAGNSSAMVTRRAVKVDTVAPILSASLPAANSAGWNNTLVTVNWTCTDATSGFADPSPCPSDESFGEADSPVPERMVTVADLAGNKSSFSRRGIKIDVTEPSASVVVAPDATTDGWNNSDVSADYDCADGGSGLDPTTPCPSDESFTEEGSYPAFSFSVDDNAGNTSAVATRRAVKIDTTPPTVKVQLRNGAGEPIAPNANGWFNQAVTVDYTCTDPTSGGVASGVATAGMPCPADYTLSSDGEYTGDSFQVADKARNVFEGTGPTVRIDTTSPSLSVDVGPKANAAGWNNTDVVVDWSCTDNGGSGLPADACPEDVTYSNGDNVAAANFTITDIAGNRSSVVTRRAVKVDTVRPVLELSVTPDANPAGWNKTNVVVGWTCTETGSGLVGTCPADVTYVHGDNVAPADFSVTDMAGNSSAMVTRRAVKVDTVAPILSASLPAANSAGWNNTLVTVNWTCTDATSGFADPSPCPSDESFGEADSPVPERMVTVADLAGNKSSFSRRGIKIDVTEPSASVVVAPDATTDGWNNSDVSADYDCADGGSGLDPTTPCPSDESFTEEGSYPAFSFSVDDNAGNTSAEATRRAVKIDTTAPTVKVQLRNAAGEPIAPNANGWFNRAVTVDYTCTDPTSGGVASGVATTAMPCPADYTLSSDGEHTASYDVSDKAGNTTSGVVPAVRIDRTAPVNQVLGVTAGQSFVVGNGPTPMCKTTDGLSGVASPAILSITGGNAAGVGEFTATCSGGTDRAGNSAQTASVAYTVGYSFLGFFQPINDPATPSTQSSFKKGSTIPVKFALANNAGVRISDAEAQAVAGNCDARLFWAKASTASSGASESLNSNPANSGNCFRYDATTDQFTYNLGTKDFTTGTWSVIARVFSGGAEHTVHSVAVSVQ